MILVVSGEGHTQLLESDDLQRLRCDIALAADDSDAAQAALDGIASLDHGHAWISTTWLRKTGNLNNGQDWPARFETMIDRARPHGWVSADGLSVKAHIVWNNPLGENA
jgi:hypothetical protein